MYELYQNGIYVTRVHLTSFKHAQDEALYLADSTKVDVVVVNSENEDVLCTAVIRNAAPAEIWACTTGHNMAHST